METLFKAGNLAAILLWIVLALALFVPAMRRATFVATGYVAPAAFAVLYIALLLGGFASQGGGFGSIAEVRQLFAGDAALTAGWFHYLAFDLFVGTWIARDSVRLGIAPLLVLPCLFLTLMFGPSGLLLYLILRAAQRRRERA